MPEMHFPPLRYDCVKCGKGCGGWRVIADDEAVARLRPTELARNSRYEPFLKCEDGLFRMGFTPAQRCVFVREDNLCAVHAELGFAAKPRACRQFPFLIVETPDGPFVGLSWRCTAVQQQHGRPVEAHRADLEELRATGAYPRVDAMLKLTTERSISWEQYLEVESAVLEGIRRLDLWAACSTVAIGRVVEPPEPLRALGLVITAGVISLLEGRDLSSQLLRGETAEGRFPLRLQHPRFPEHDEAIRTYLEHLVFRKFLCLGSSVLSRLGALYLAIPMLRIYTEATGDFLKALEIVEGEMLTHSEDLEGTFVAIEEGIRRHLS